MAMVMLRVHRKARTQVGATRTMLQPPDHFPQDPDVHPAAVMLSYHFNIRHIFTLSFGVLVWDWVFGVGWFWWKNLQSPDSCQDKNY